MLPAQHQPIPRETAVADASPYSGALNVILLRPNVRRTASLLSDFAEPTAEAGD